MKALTLSGLSLAILAASVTAAPWVDTADLYLRTDIQTLADAGIITVPVNTYPLMWSGIGVDLGKAEPSLMTEAQAQAYARVNFYYQQVLANRGASRLRLSATDDAARFQHFGSDYREKGELGLSHEYLGSRFAFKLAATATLDPQDDETLRADGSYLAMIAGNWVLTAGALEQWWGPGFDTALHRSNNARPMPALTLSRNNAAAFETPWLSWIGPWTLTTGVAWMNDDRAVEDALLWQFRGTLRPFKQLEIGTSWTTQLCGEGQPCGMNTFFKAISGGTECVDGSDNCDPSQNTKIGNQMAGFDLRYADTWFNVPVGLYLERTCEDSSGKMPWQLADCANLVGVDSRFGGAGEQFKVFLEYSNTQVACGENQNSFNCFYEHSTYLSGSRYQKRSLGSTYDSDAKVLVLGFIGQYGDSKGVNALLRYAKLNEDGSNRGGDWSPKPTKEELLMLELSYRQPAFKGMLTLGGSAGRSEFVSDSETNAGVFGAYEYRF
ncbi:capsule assembly Wzi family protein [Shewanella sedimentimangrovi]|uniref:Capsule assembly Wzi family protein n=1 Tax=Shewanella sedimentimangrovi TaxID=2814293 RepID=A0ABX7R3H8_9GAMM|nr:capsule assembly Wzi family protein [Shewanella sedimentimangrovi]QSX37388.1 capsule assembly Wzi family protein [Shewanella sedimentimangrovi]